ncbi:hypothetical protein HAX54_012752 [Datura stramonium]|uniref:Uncharacterized protein n=1 Tax=Datura stramonium TaxID=4076 RepID=A0ABS8RXM0_DATST|nr:hypothetical protein [Datura stramonium]
MASCPDKGKELVVTDKGFKWLRKGTKGSSSSAPKHPLLGGSETSTTASRADKGKEVVVTDKGLKLLRKGTKGSSSSAAKAYPIRRIGSKDVEEHGLNCFNAHMEAKYAPKN